MYKIAIVEDDQAVRLMYKLKLEHAGHKVKVATNGQEGLSLAEEFAPDLLLLDLRMPVMDGAEMLNRLRATDWGSNIRVIILANSSKQEAPQALRFLHVDRYIEKAHFTPAQVVAIVSEVLGAT